MEPQPQSFTFWGRTLRVGDRIGTRTVLAVPGHAPRTHHIVGGYATVQCDCGRKTTEAAGVLLGHRKHPGRTHVCRPSRPRPLPPDEAAKERARRAVAAAVASGLLVRPEHCSLCRRAARRIVGHHRDYAHPLAVVWCCDLCHAADHARMRQGAPAQQPA